MAIVSPATHIKDLLVGASLGAFGGTADWALYIGWQPDAPDRSVTITDTGGPESTPNLLLDYKTVQIRVRGKRGDYEAGYIRSVQVQTVLLGINPQTMGNGDRIDGIIQAGGIGFMGFDAENQRPEFVMNYQLFFEPSAANLPGTHRISL